jgi:hypothetical protein
MVLPPLLPSCLFLHTQFVFLNLRPIRSVSHVFLICWWLNVLLFLFVSLPREWIQGFKCMTMMYFTHALFLTCTQKSHLYLPYMYLGIYTMYKQFHWSPLTSIKNPCFTYLEGQLLTCGDEFPSTLVLSLVTTVPPLGFYPFHPFLTPQFTSHDLHRWHQQSGSSSSGTLLSIGGGSTSSSSWMAASDSPFALRW